jgi:hypothetical protein
MLRFDPKSLELYGSFSEKTLDGDYDLGYNNQGVSEYSWDGMNTRHAIGIDCVNFEENPRDLD